MYVRKNRDEPPTLSVCRHVRPPLSGRLMWRPQLARHARAVLVQSLPSCLPRASLVQSIQCTPALLHSPLIAVHEIALRRRRRQILHLSWWVRLGSVLWSFVGFLGLACCFPTGNACGWRGPLSPKCAVELTAVCSLNRWRCAPQHLSVPVPMLLGVVALPCSDDSDLLQPPGSPNVRALSKATRCGARPGGRDGQPT